MADDHPDVERARERLADRYGETLARKATAAFAVHFGDVKQRAAFEASPADPSDVAQRLMRPGMPIVLSCAASQRPDLLRVLREGIHAAARRARAQAGGAAPDAATVRRQFVQELRNDFEQRASPLRDQLEAMTERMHQLEAGPAAAVGMAPGRTEMCWLNTTLRVRTDAHVLAEYAEDPLIERIDLDRLLEREIDGTVPLVGAPGYSAALGVDGSGVVIAVLDGEVDAGHAALAPRVTHKRNYTLEPWGHPDLHGTAVAGIAASAHATYRGVAPGAAIWSYKIFRHSGPASAFDGTLALQDAVTDGAHVANCSWRGPGPADGAGREAAAVDAAWALGLVVVKSAGNAGPGMGTVTPPSGATGVIVVGAASRAGTGVEDYSSRGPSLNGLARPHLVAPGGDHTGGGIRSCAPGTTRGFHDAGAGTSHAAPHVSGAAALLLQHEPGLSPEEVRAALIGASAPIAGGDAAVEGAGLLDLSRLVPSTR